MTTEIIAQRRNTIRGRLQRVRRQLSSQAILSSELACSAYLSPALKHPSKIAGYLAIAGEMAVDRTLHYCRELGSTTYLPIVRNDTLMFAEVTASTPMVKNRFGIDEPATAASTWVQPMDLDYVLVPLVAFDANCNRLGMGGGFYDKSFAQRIQQKAPPHLIGVAHAFQEVQTVYPESWDVPLDRVVTDEQVFIRD
ncbi:MAG: 5-formyltetrahydrofolate cyclo-ligase [Gammaproteobacteria bacterium]|nr:5-formyltetrahydrofolate cyclo-ligase [Gammaproteobacteria bacterium]